MSIENTQPVSLNPDNHFVGLDSLAIRSKIRSNSFQGQTAGLAPGRLQANLVIMPEEFAFDFSRFCQRNPKPCPLSGVSDTGNPMMHTMGQDIDIRTDVSAYNIYRYGKLVNSSSDIIDIWQEDFVVFALGCSFTFEHAVQRAGVKLWHIENNTTVPMFRTNIDCIPSGAFSGNMVVSMRSVPKEQVQLVSEISAKYPLAHGAPVHVGSSESIGIMDLEKPDWGDPAPIEQGYVPVFWACGVTPQVAIEKAQIPIVITHKPGHMLISDIDECAETPIIKPKTSGD
ncbi:MAG: putative hydro-lyase [Rhizobiaceae bacterium]